MCVDLQNSQPLSWLIIVRFDQKKSQIFARKPFFHISASYWKLNPCENARIFAPFFTLSGFMRHENTT